LADEVSHLRLKQNISDQLYPSIHTSLWYLTASPLAISSAEIISQQIYSTEVSKI